MKLLHIDSSILGDNSVSRALTAQLVARLRTEDPKAELHYRDLAARPLSHLTGGHLAGQASADEQADGAAALEEFEAADTVVIGAPMYNFSIPSQLKSWIDRITVAGRTFRYSANGAEGLAGGKTVYIVSSRGSRFDESSGLAALDHQESYLRTIFGFLGITDIRFVRAEGLAIDADARAEAISAAEQQIAAPRLLVA